MSAMTDQGDQLGGWKEIAGFLKVTERTAQRWHEKDGMPVHHLPHGSGSNRVAYRSELTSWKKRRMKSGRSMKVLSFARQSRPYALALAAVSLAALTACLFFRTPRSMAAWSLVQHVYAAPDHLYIVQKREAKPNAFEMCELNHGAWRCGEEWRFCPKSNGYHVPLYAGFVVTQFKVVMSGDCIFFDDTDGDMKHFVIARTVDRNDARPGSFSYLYRDLTHDDPLIVPNDHRPILLNGCETTPGDTDTVCNLSEADFLPIVTYTPR
jgi:hypothetical protein